jgi:NAD(P)-dependent dehydrogenase (short-subunit alcohol dehydrogenase family)
LSGVLVFDREGTGLAAALRARGLDAEAASGWTPGRDDLVTVAPRLELEPLADLEPDIWLERFRRWVEEPFAVVQAWLRDLAQRDASGGWVAVTSNLGTQSFPFAGAIGSFSAALHTLVKVAALEYGPRGVRANAVAVGFRDGETPAWIDVERVAADTPAGRLTRVDDIAGVVAWLLSPATAQVNGEIVRVDGGFTLARGRAAAPSDAAEAYLLDEQWRGLTR